MRVRVHLHLLPSAPPWPLLASACPHPCVPALHPTLQAYCPCAPRRLTRAHCALVLHANMVERIGQLQVGASTVAVLRQLATLFALTWMEKQLGDLLEDGYMTGVGHGGGAGGGAGGWGTGGADVGCGIDGKGEGGGAMVGGEVGGKGATLMVAWWQGLRGEMLSKHT